MPNKPHCLLLGNAGPRESSYDRHARAMERKMRETYAPKETVPVARLLCRHVVCHLSAFLFHFREKWSQSRDKRSCVATPSFNRERDLICSGIHICQRKRRLAKPTALADGNFKGNAHPRRLGFELFPYQRFFFRRDLVFVFRTVRSDAEFRARISSREFPRDRFKHNDAPNADIEECAIETHGAKSRVFGRMLAPVQILHDMLSFQLAWSVHVLGFKKRAYCIPSLPVFFQSVRLSAAAGFQKRDNPPIKILRIGNTGGVGLLLIRLALSWRALAVSEPMPIR